MSTFADRILIFYKNLAVTSRLPNGVKVLNPYQDDATFELCSLYYRKYYNDNRNRRVIIGINPGRLGAGLTGIPFTDPVKLEKICGIPNHLQKKAELSADFIHSMIDAYGGHSKFCRNYFFSSVSPLGYTLNGKNVNYYDSPELLQTLDSFIRLSMRQLIELGVDREQAFCLGEGQNYKYLVRLNEEEKLFNKITPLAHPRFIMQYKRKYVQNYIEDYLQKLQG